MSQNSSPSHHPLLNTIIGILGGLIGGMLIAWLSGQIQLAAIVVTVVIILLIAVLVFLYRRAGWISIFGAVIVAGLSGVLIIMVSPGISTTGVTTSSASSTSPSSSISPSTTDASNIQTSPSATTTPVSGTPGLPSGSIQTPTATELIVATLPSGQTIQPIETGTTSPNPSTANNQIITDTFDTGQLNPNLWQPPSDPTMIFVEESALHFQVTQQQVVNGASATLSLSPQIDPIRAIDFTMTMVSFDRSGQGGVGLRAFMTDGPDHYISLTHDNTNAAVELGTCKSKTCAGNYADYHHPDALIIKEGQPVRMRIAWEENAISLYVDGIKRAVVAAENTPIKDFRFSLFSTPGGAFELTVDNIAIIYDM